MAAGDPGSPARYYSSTAVETSLQSSIAAQSQGASNTSFIVASVSGFPTQYPYTLIVDPDTSKEEVVTVTSASSTTLTVTRGSDNTQAVAHSAGAVVRHGVSGRDFREAENHIAARGYDIDETILAAANQTHVHGLQTGDGVVVGTSKTQTLTNKTYSSGTFTGSFTASSATFVSPTISGSPVITGLSSAGMVDSSATPKNYVDSILGSATAAATSAASAAASATAAATSAASAATSATSAATSATSADSAASIAIAQASNASTSASAAATSATSAAASATAAATSATSAANSATASATSASAAATSATSADASATAAATSAASALASATAAATSAASAAASTSAAAASAAAAATSEANASASATAAATSASSAATSASSALTSANSAATSAASAAAATSAAAASASDAATSAASAATSATSAATTYDEFDDRYLGSKSTPPTTDNDGNPLIEGALYWNSVSNAMFAWTGTEWGSISSTAEIFRYRYTAAGGETSESGPDDNGVTLSYIPGKEQVYLNGVLLVRSQDYTATNGTSISSLSPALTSGDVLEIITFTAFDIATAIPNSILDAKGDLIVASASDTPGKLSAGSEGQVLTVQSTASLGLTWTTISGYSAPTLGTTVVTSGVTISTINGLTDVVLNGPGSVTDELTLILMGAL